MDNEEDKTKNFFKCLDFFPKTFDPCKKQSASGETGLLNEMADPGCPLAMKRRRKRFIAMKKQRVRFLDEEILWWRSQKVQLKREIELLELEKEKLEENLNSTLGSHFTTISSNSMRDAQTTVSSDCKLNDVGAAAPLEEDEPNPPPIAATPQETSPSSDDCPEWLKKRIKCLKEICLENVLEHSELHEKVIKLTREIAELKEMNRKLQGSRIRVEIRQRLNQVPQPSAIINTTEEEQGVNDVSTASTSSSLNHGIPVPDIYELGGQMKEKQGQKKSGSEVNRQQSPKAQSPGVSVQKATHRRPPSPEAVRPSEKENQVPLTGMNDNERTAENSV